LIAVKSVSLEIAFIRAQSVKSFGLVESDIPPGPSPLPVLP